MRKRGLAFLLFVLIVAPIFLTSIVSANVGDDIASGMKSFIQGVTDVGKPIFEALLGSIGDSPEVFILKILSFLLVTVIIYGTLSVVNIFGEKGWVNFVVGMIVSLIGLRFLPPNFLEAMAIPSSALVATIVLLMPLVVLILIGTKITSTVARKIFYITYGCIVIVLWFYNWNNTNLDGIRWLYPLVALACIALFLFDGTIQRFWGKASAQRTLEYTSSNTRDTIIGEIRNLESAMAAATDVKEINRLKKEIDIKKKALAAL